MLNRFALICLGVMLLSVAAFANTTSPAACSPSLDIFTLGAGSNSVSCPAFMVPGGTLTGVTVSWAIDYLSGTAVTNTIQEIFTPAVFSTVTWSPAMQTLSDTGGASSGPEPTGMSSAATGVTNANFASAFSVAVSSSVLAGGVGGSSAAVTVVYTYTPPPPLTLSCPTTTSGTAGSSFSATLIASGGVPAYTYAITGGSISPLTLNASTGVISGTLPSTPGTISFTAMVTDSIAETASTTGSCVFTINQNSPPPPPSVCSASTPVFPAQGGAPADVFQIRYAANLNIGDAYIDITNAGTAIDPSTGASSNLCINVYTFDTQEELISCCACLVTPNALQSISFQTSLINNPLTPAIPSAAVVKLVATVPSTGVLAPGMLAWGTSLHSNTSTSSSSYGLTETPFSPSTLSRAELSHITSTCGFIQKNGSKFGICGGCNSGGLGSTTTTQ